MSSQDDIPPGSQKFGNRIGWILAGIFVIGLIVGGYQKTLERSSLRKEATSLREGLSTGESLKNEYALYLRRIKDTQLIKRLVLEEGILKGIEDLHWRDGQKNQSLEKTQIVTVYHRDSHHVITYIQDQDGKKRGHFLL